MLSSNYTKDLLNLQDVNIINVQHFESERSFTSIAKDVNLSVSTVIRFFDILSYPAPKELPQVLSIHGNLKNIIVFDFRECNLNICL